MFRGRGGGGGANCAVFDVSRVPAHLELPFCKKVIGRGDIIRLLTKREANDVGIIGFNAFYILFVEAPVTSQCVCFGII